MNSISLVKICNSDASDLMPKLLKMDIINRFSKIQRFNEFRLVPIKEGKESEALMLGLEIVEAHSIERRTPQEMIMEELSSLPEAVKKSLPTKWEYVGDIAIIRLNSEHEPYEELIGKSYAKILKVKTICADMAGVSGEFRRPSIKVLYGENKESIRLENGIKYFFDVTKVMYSSGNVDERFRMKNLDCSGETVVDMFAGIGYFTLPIAKFTGARRVFSCEKNPESYNFLLKNIKINNVEEIVVPILGDNRDILGKHFADRILMGYVQNTSEFLPKALTLIKKNGIIHYHNTFYVNEKQSRIEKIFEGVCGKGGFKIESIKEVKSFAPSVSHFVADVKIL